MRLPVLEQPARRDLDRDRARLASELAAAGFRGRVHVDAHHRALYATDASIYEVEPLAVVVPGEVEDLDRLARCCADLRLPLIGRGAGTSLAGQTVGEAIIVDCSERLDGCGPVERAPDGRATVWVGPGLVLDDLNRRLAGAGLAFGPNVSTATHATLGGMIMNCSAGTHSLLYGMTDEHLEAVDLVLADGRTLRFEEGASERDSEVAAITHRIAEIVLPLAEEIDARYPKLRRNVAGYALDDLLAQFRASSPGTHDRVNLARLVCGSEGTLGLLRGARLALVPRPSHRELVLVCFDDMSAAMEAVVPILSTAPAAIELMDRTIIDAAASQPLHAESVGRLTDREGSRPAAVLFVEWFREDDASGCGGPESLAGLVGDARLVPIEPGPASAAMWSVRNTGLGLISKAEGSVIPMPGVEDCAVPVDRLAGFQSSFDAMLRRHGRTAVYYAHASVGLLHMRPRIDVADPADLADFEAIGREALELVRIHGGTISGEHGDGRIRARLVHEFYGPGLVEAFTAIKAVFDPEGRLNPGNKIVARPPLEPLRTAWEPLPEARSTRPALAFDSEGALADAARACNGNGLCRRLEGGAMCPSYRATREERHSTRGRANAMARAIREGGDLEDEALGETLDLCLGCKACRHECPSNVDVTRLKTEYLARRWSRRAAPLRERLLGRSFFRLARVASRWHRVVGPLSGTSLARRITASVLGLDPERTLPRFVRSLQSRLEGRAVPVEDGAPVVVMMPDCFTNTMEPEIGLAAIRVLEAFGYRVVVPADPVCCGRVAVSGGFLPEAERLIGTTVESLRRHVDSTGAVAVIALEPSCASAMREEWLELPLSRPGDDATFLAGRTRLLEEFLLERWDTHPKRARFASRAGAEPILVHQHCHQKAASRTLRELLERCLDGPVTLLDSGCCGMAGAFGYRRENAGLSRRIAEQSLGEALRSGHEPLVAPGTSCRQQVSGLFGRTAVHPALHLASALEESLSGSSAPRP